MATFIYSQESLVWSDEFNIDGPIDSSKWFHQTQLPSGGNWYNNEEQHYTDRLENSYVSNGILNIVAKKEEYTEQGQTKQYTSARLNSKEAFKYGRLVIRAKLPSGAGTWPAIWMLGKNINEDGGYWDATYGTTAWPACGEIDIMEHWGKNQNFVQSAMHTPSSYGGTINHGGQNIPTASNDFHVYELDWNAERMIFSVDGIVHYTYNPSTKNACEWPYDAEQYFLLNIAIEQGGADITETAMEIDYIRVYQNSEGYTSSNTTLIDLKTNGETINVFNCTSPSSYTVTLPNNASVPVTTATPTDTSATVIITPATSIPGNTIVEVTAADGITTENYTISFVTTTDTDTNPTIAAPSPTKASSDVISVFSDVYSSISTDTDPNWGQATDATEININGNMTLKYENLTYQGLDYEVNTDVSSMDYIHLDYYTDNATAFEFFLISSGPLENSYNIATNEGIILGQWISVDIPLSSYTVPDLSNLFQFKTVGNGTLYLDNLYFWKESDIDASLSDLKVDGTTVDNFASGTLNYNVTLPEDTVDVPIVTATTSQNGASASVSQAISLPGTTTVNVTASDGTSVATYNVNFILSGGYSQTLLEDFENPATYSVVADLGVTYNTVTDPETNGIRGNVLEIITSSSGMQWQNAQVTLTSSIDLTASEKKVSVDIYSTSAFVMLAKVDEVNTSGLGYAASASEKSHTGSGWETLTFDFTDGDDNTSVADDAVYPRLLFFPLRAIDGWEVPAVTTRYVDNITLLVVPTPATWIGTDGDFTNASNWSSGVVPGASSDITIPSDAELNITGDITVNSMSIAAGASIISDGSITGTVSYTRSIPTDNWYLISSPVVGQDKDAFVTASGFATSGSNVGFADYNNTSEAWSYYQSGSIGSGAFTQGQGHSVKLATAGDVVFTGTFNDADASIAVTNNTNGFNLIGNPYLASVSVSELLNNNGSLLSESTVWLWDQSSSSYVQKNLAADLEIAPGQAFFISANTSGDFGITESMQSHSADTFQRTVAKPEVELSLSNGKASRTASIYYIDGATTGFDNGYDSSIFGGFDNDFSLYTHAVANGTGRNLGIQSLPKAEYQNMIIPVGVIAESGSSLEFSASSENLPEGIKIYLEDREENTFIRLDALNASYKLTTESAINGVGRFYLYTTSSALSTDDIALNNNMSIYTSSKENLRVVGVQNGTATIQLHTILGKEVLRRSFKGNGVNDIALPILTNGTYIVKLVTKTGITNKKIIIQ